MKWARYITLYILYCLIYFLLEKVFSWEMTTTILDILISGVFFVGFYALIESFIKRRSD